MILVDTSVWVDHLRRGNARLVSLLEETEVCSHPFVVGELACGRLKNRREILALLKSLPQLPSATDDEVLYFIDQQKLMGRGVGYVDVHLLAAAKLAGISELWTLDKRLDAVTGVLAG